MILRKHAALAKLSDNVIDDLARISTVVRLRRGDAMWRVGELAQTMTVIGHGLIKVVLPSSATRDRMVGLVGPTESVGDSELLDGTTYPTNTIALTDPVIVARIPGSAVVAALSQSGTASLEVARALGRTASAAHRRVLQSAASAEERLAGMLIELADRFGDDLDDNTTLIPLKLTRADLAALVGTTVETTIRTLSRWSREGLVATVDNGLCIRDNEGLAQRSVQGPRFSDGDDSGIVSVRSFDMAHST